MTKVTLKLAKKEIMKKMKEMAESVHKSIIVTVDCVHNHAESRCRLPTLDVEVWVGRGEDDRMRIMHSHYMKDVSSRLVMKENSAHGENTKRNVMVNELCRIMKNCSVYLPWNEVSEKVSYFVKRMAYCGYDDKVRYAVVKIAVGRHKKRIESWKKGEGMFEEKRTEGERRDAIKKKREWYKSDGKYDSVMFVQPTVGSQLKKKIQVIARKNKVKLKVIEKAGQTVKNVLQRSNPFGKAIFCGREMCMVCILVYHGGAGRV